MVFAPLLRDPGLRGPGKGTDMGFFKTKQNKPPRRLGWPKFEKHSIETF